MFYSYTNKWTADKRRGGVISAVITSDQVGVGISFCVFLPGSSQSFVFLIKGKQSKQTPHWIYKSEKWLTTVFISLRSGINYNIMALTQYLNKYCDYCFMSVKKKKLLRNVSSAGLKTQQHLSFLVWLTSSLSSSKGFWFCLQEKDFWTGSLLVQHDAC